MNPLNPFHPASGVAVERFQVPDAFELPTEVERLRVSERAISTASWSVWPSEMASPFPLDALEVADVSTDSLVLDDSLDPSDSSVSIARRWPA